MAKRVQGYVSANQLDKRNDRLIVRTAVDNEFKEIAVGDVKGDVGPKITGAAFSGKNLVFTLEDSTTFEIPDAKDVLKGDAGLTDAQIESLIGNKIKAGTGIQVTYDSLTGETTINALDSSYELPAITGFDINIANTINVGEQLNVSKDLSFTVVNYQNISSLKLISSSGDEKTLTKPTQDGAISQAVTLSNVDTSQPKTLTFKLEITDTRNTKTYSNIKSVVVQQVAQTEKMYYGDDSAETSKTIDVNSILSLNVAKGSSHTLDFDLPNNGWAIILLPSEYTVTSIKETVFNQEILNDFIKVVDTREINGKQYTSYVHQNKSGVQGDFQILITIGGTV